MTGEINATIPEQRLMITVEWKICNFFGLSEEMDHAVDSPNFTFMNASWHIRIYTNGQKKHDSLGWMEMYLVKNRSKTSFLRNVVFQFGIRKEGGDYVSRNIEHKFSEKDEGFGLTKILQRSTLLTERNMIESEDIVTLFCTIYSPIIETTQKTSQVIQTTSQATEVASQAMQTTFQAAEVTSQATQTTFQATEVAPQTTQMTSHETEARSQTAEAASQTTQEGSRTTHPEISGFEKLSEDLMGLLLNNDDGDVVLKVKDQEMKVHRTILKARSSVFRAMFEHGMQEASTGVVHITDCNPAIFPDFLHYLYSGQVEEFSTNKVFDLYRVADKYDVAELKVKCVEFIMANMSVGTFFDAITLALRHSEPELLERATTFFKDAISEIVVKAEWLSFLKENHVEANELYIKALKVQKS